MGKRQTAPNPDHEQQPADETIAEGKHMDLDAMDDQLAAERAAGVTAPTGVVLASSFPNPYVSEEMQGMEMIAKTFGPPQYGSPDPASAAGRLMTLEDGHPLAGLPEDHPVAISEDYGEPGTVQRPEDAVQLPHEGAEIDATDGATELASEENIDLSEVNGTGADGRITKSDVEDYIAARENN
jgi:pyruvate/2-oxoglutarate dehydrogenase complex dihydrolipoamide acyltransferase (E2) component